ncbi:hypothetical protein EVAR_42831_1 [Eumeta japonica]|uniref:Carboxylesterase type B domain-containing protein n=1 Tax=Eumeta variegata TaxID=151549 RepID=A0A4C1WH16_EUMVA|nr:hypothetical protein EVAR_42831_1 [Eumeta japonica]
MVVVRVSEGLLEGEVVRSVLGREYCSFKGIPYAQPPIGDLRFKLSRILVQIRTIISYFNAWVSARKIPWPTFHAADSNCRHPSPSVPHTRLATQREFLPVPHSMTFI